MHEEWEISVLGLHYVRALAGVIDCGSLYQYGLKQFTVVLEQKSLPYIS